MRLARREQAESRTLLAGFRVFGPALRLMLLEGVILFFIVLTTTQLGSFLYMMTPFAAPLNAVLEPLLESGTLDTLTVTEVLLNMEQRELMRIFRSMLPFLLLPAAVILIPLSYRVRLAQYILLDRPKLGAIYALLLSFKLMKKRCLQLFVLDLRLWWFYTLEILVQVLCYGDLLLPLVGVTPKGSVVLLSFLFYALALACQLGLHMWQKPQVMTAYALFYDGLLPKEEVQAEA
jgi:uncharacterized membrane protein